MDTKLHLGSIIVVEPDTSVRSLGVYTDGELNRRVHTNLVCLFLPSTSPQSTSKHHVLSYIAASRIYICSLSIRLLHLSPSRFTCCHSKTVAESYERAVRLVAGVGWRDHIKPAMRDLHWLPIVNQIRYKL